jgi:acetyl-CoA synthetase
MAGSSEFVWDVPHGFNFGRDVIDQLASERRTGLVAIAAGGSRREYSFPEIAELSQRWAAALHRAGIGKGDRVIVAMPKVPEWLFAMIALLRLGAVAVPVADQLRARDVLYRANHSEARALIAHASVVPELEQMRPDAHGVSIRLVSGPTQAPYWTEIEPSLASVTPFAGVPTTVDDLACILYTSGTTKDPKCVVHSVS